MMMMAFVLLVSLFVGAGAAWGADLDAWLQTAELGEYQPVTEDWEAIAEAAQAEPPLTLYTDTSRAFPVVEQFNELYGLEVEAINLRGAEIIERVRREWDAGLYNAGVVMMGSAALVYDQLLSRNAVTRYVPREMEAVIDPNSTEPLLVHRYSVGVWYFKNAENPEEPPFENIWEMTTDAWNNRVAMSSPLASGTTMEYFIGLVSNHEEMAAMYEDFFGEPIQLTTENAGFEFIKGLLENDVRLVTSFRDVADAVTRADDHFAGFGSQSAYRQVVTGEYEFELDTQITPAVLSPRLIGIGTYTESPNTAKLLIRYLTSQEGGDPWWGADFPANPVVEQTGAMATLTLDTFDKLWDTPLGEQLDLRDQITDFFIMYQ